MGTRAERDIPCSDQPGSKPCANGGEYKAIGFIIPAGPEDRGRSKVWSLSWTSVFLPVGAGVCADGSGHSSIRWFSLEEGEPWK